jgi:hypothetical protein
MRLLRCVGCLCCQECVSQGSMLHAQQSLEGLNHTSGVSKQALAQEHVLFGTVTPVFVIIWEYRLPGAIRCRAPSGSSCGYCVFLPVLHCVAACARGMCSAQAMACSSRLVQQHNVARLLALVCHGCFHAYTTSRVHGIWSLNKASSSCYVHLVNGPGKWLKIC